MWKIKEKWTIAYNFADFIRDSRKKCRTKEDFIVKVLKEIEHINVIPADHHFHLDKQAYLKRLLLAKFAAISLQFEEPDKYNEELTNLLESLA